jgi:hypothetical protein
MHHRSGCRAVPCGLVLLAAACTNAPNAGSVATGLTQRLDMRLASEIASGQATLQQLPDGARVTLSDAVLFPAGGVTLDGRGRYTCASVIQGLLAPSLLRIDVAGSTTAPGAVQDLQARAVSAFFEDYGINVSAQSPPAPADPAQAAPASGVAITIRFAPV